MEKHILPMLIVLCCWLALCSARVIKNENKASKDDTLTLLDKENTKKSSATQSVTEELSQNLMESLYDELRKRTVHLSTDDSSKRSAPAPPEELPEGRPPGLWGREAGATEQNEKTIGIWGRSTGDQIPGIWGRRSVGDRPIPGIWGRSTGDQIPGIWGRRSAEDGPIPGIWGRRSAEDRPIPGIWGR